MRLRFPARIGLALLSLLAIVVGLATGIGAVLFRALIGLIHNIAFLGVVSIDYDSSVFTPPSPWGFFLIFVPVLGGMLVTS
jgi:CIC family chloride channel protein